VELCFSIYSLSSTILLVCIFCVHVYVGSILLYFVLFCVGLIDFAVIFCCPYQCK